MTIRMRPSPFFWAVNRLIDACEDLFDLVIELSMALLTMMACLTREEPTGPRPLSGEWCVRTLQQFGEGERPGAAVCCPRRSGGRR